MCAYTHSQDGGNKNKIYELKKEVDELKQHVKNLFELCHNETKSKIKKLEDEVSNLKLEIKKLVQMDNNAPNKSQDILNVKLPEAVNASLNIPVKIKCKCDMCDASFKQKITLEKHRNSKHNKIYCSPNEKDAFDVIPGQETDAEALMLEWRYHKKDVKITNEKEKNAVYDKVENDNNENSEFVEKKKR